MSREEERWDAIYTALAAFLIVGYLVYALLNPRKELPFERDYIEQICAYRDHNGVCVPHPEEGMDRD